MDFERARFNMIEQTIRPAVSLDPQTIETLGLVRRERFIPASMRGLAYADIDLPLPGGHRMLKPEIIGRLLQAIAPQRGEAVLVIGSGGGYLPALLAVHADSVHCMEIDAEVAAMADANLLAAGVANVSVEEGDGIAGCAECAPYDLIVASGAVETVPQAWLAQLKPGGRLFAFVGNRQMTRAQLIRRLPQGGVETRELFETQVAQLRAPATSHFAF